MTDASIHAFREHYRRENVPPGYRGSRHLMFTFGVGGLAFAGCLLQLGSVRPVDWLAVPVTFLYANLAEYWGHRGPMHHRTRGLGLLY